jgi:hypothetical protein
MADDVTLPGAGLKVATKELTGGKHAQIMRLDSGDDVTPRPASFNDPYPMYLFGTNADYYPGYGSPEVSGPGLVTVDPDGNLRSRSAVLTDEGTFRCNFANASLDVSIGTVSIVGNVVTGTGFVVCDVHKGDYFKLNADGESARVAIATVNSDTELVLDADYVGGTSGAASRSLMRSATGAGGSIAVTNGQCVMTSGTTASAVTRIERAIDIAPLIFRTRLSISQRIANLTIPIGMTESDASTDRWFARFSASGTVNTVLVCETGRNPSGAPSAAETETTTTTIPNGKTTAMPVDYRVEQLTESVRFYIDGILVAEHTKVIPSQHDLMDGGVFLINGATPPATSTTVTVDYVTGKNHNKLEVGIMSDAEKIISAVAPLVPINFSQAGVIAINTNLASIDCSQLRSIFVQCVSMGTAGVVTPYWSNDGVNYLAATMQLSNGSTANTFNAAGLWYLPVYGRYLQLRLTTATTAGTTTLSTVGSQSNLGTPAGQSISGTVGVTGYPTAAASGDALANPTVTKVDVTNLVFNGTTWDRQRGMSTALTTGDTGAKVATGVGVTITNVGSKGVQITLNMGAVTGTNPTFVLKVQGSTDAGTTWYDIPGATTATLNATGQYGITIYPGVTTVAGVATPNTTAATGMVIPRTWRVVWTIGGTTPSFTITAVQYMYLPN